MGIRPAGGSPPVTIAGADLSVCDAAAVASGNHQAPSASSANDGNRAASIPPSASSKANVLSSSNTTRTTGLSGATASPWAGTVGGNARRDTGPESTNTSGKITAAGETTGRN